jgi:sugar/nucleoside kinase (ribokinase family)
MTDKSVNKKLIAGIGSALIDILAHEDDDFLETMGAEKGGMILVDDNFIEQTLSKISDKPSVVPGGSACNTIIGVAKLGGSGRFIGMRGEDELGKLIEADLNKNHVEPILFTSQVPTGRVLSIITPDAQRSFLTNLGAASQMMPQDISDKCFKNAEVVLVEGYLLFNAPDLMETAMKAARKAGAKIAMDLSSCSVVETFKELLEKLVAEYVDILMANEDEALAFTGHSDEMKAIEALSKDVDIAVLKVGKRGSYISGEGKVIKVASHGTGAAIDTTGAGDLWASGFLFGIVNGYTFEKCGELGSVCGWEVCRVVGANIPEEGWERIYKLL